MNVKRWIRNTALSLLAVGLAVGVAIAVVPAYRHYVAALLNDPKTMPALESDGRVHYEEGAKSCAQDIAALLPAAIELVETRQGRPFRRPPIIGVYASYDLFARANGLEAAYIAATSRAGRVILSPALCASQKDRVAGILAHELSHSHFFGWRSSFFSPRPPSWFTEGLAVMVSNGGAAEETSEQDAAAAMKRGDQIIVEDGGLWTDFASIPFHGDMRGSLSKDAAFRQRLAYREAAMFLAWLQASDPSAFARLLNDLENGEPFRSSFLSAYAESPATRWKQFAADIARTR